MQLGEKERKDTQSANIVSFPKVLLDCQRKKRKKSPIWVKLKQCQCLWGRKKAALETPPQKALQLGLGRKTESYEAREGKSY